MGCDIHAYREIKVAGKWHYAGPAHISRRYGVFGLMTAGFTRGEDDGLGFKPKGLPADVSEPVKASNDEWDTDGHSHSYLTSEELHRLREKFIEWDKQSSDPEWWRTEFGEVDRHLNLLDFHDERQGYSGDEDDWTPSAWIEDVRLVYWFDN